MVMEEQKDHRNKIYIFLKLAAEKVLFVFLNSISTTHCLVFNGKHECYVEYCLNYIP